MNETAKTFTFVAVGAVALLSAYFINAGAKPIEVEGSGDLSAKGNMVDHEYKIERDGDKVAEVSKRWFRVRDTYGIEIADEQNDALIVAVAVCIDQMGRGE